MCKKNLKKQNVVEELSWGGGGDFRKSTKTPNTEREEKKEKKEKKKKEKKESYEMP